MRVYAESNFVLEIVLEQEQHLACDGLIGLAVDRSIELVLPAYALLEPHETLARRIIEWKRLRSGLDIQHKQLQRSASMSVEASQLGDASYLLIRAEQNAKERFFAVRERLLGVAQILPIDGPALLAAGNLVKGFALNLPDALMLASVLADAEARPAPSVFLNRNTNDFDDPEIVACLRRLRCDFIGSFGGGLARVKKMLAAPPAPDS
ncbi:hypothetical protein WME75_09335 [Sorangium sp. So ce1014]|uniref:hypothetical protein n=1 Tax=Sorangium sp. So ce1014 TaxID=3133326 RepID=UPI003F64433E